MVRINLLPPEYRPKPQINPARLLFMLLVVLTPILLGGGTVYGYLQLQELRSEIARIQQERAELGPLYDSVIGIESTLNGVRAKLANMDKVTATHLDPVGFFAALNVVVPESVMISNLSLAPGGKVSMGGSSLDYYGVAAFQLKMDVSDAFRDVILKGANGEDKVSFTMTSTYSASGSGPQATPRGVSAAAPAQAADANSGTAEAGASQPPASGGQPGGLE